MFRVLFFVLLSALFGRASAEIPASSRQVVLVTSSGWSSSQATVRLFERTNAGWQARGTAFDALTGRNGMAWGIGLHRRTTVGPIKEEGDGCAPAGVFRFGPVFTKDARTFAMPFVRIGPGSEGVDDPASRYYNQLVDHRKVARPDWKSSEKLFESPHYGLGIWVRHNPDAVPGAGSCIYIHDWVGRRGGTAGCTVLRRSDLEKLLTALNSRKNPVLVQMPEAIARARFPQFFANAR